MHVNYHLTQANIRHLSMHGQPAESGLADTRGHILRQLRLTQQRDPAQLASAACLSLQQLKQLENGEASLFYSEGARNLAGRRVAALLGTCWEDMGEVGMPPQAAPMPLALPPALTTVRPDTHRGWRPAGVKSALWLLAGLINLGIIATLTDLLGLMP